MRLRYDGVTAENQRVMKKWLFHILEQMDEEDRSRFLYFATGA
jgi:hypothetical protein